MPRMWAEINKIRIMKLELKAHFKNLDYQIIELYEGPLYDGGSIFFI